MIEISNQALIEIVIEHVVKSVASTSVDVSTHYSARMLAEASTTVSAAKSNEDLDFISNQDFA